MRDPAHQPHAWMSHTGSAIHYVANIATRWSEVQIPENPAIYEANAKRYIARDRVSNRAEIRARLADIPE